MGIDTVKLRSPDIDETLAVYLENQSILRQGIELSSGEILYELTAGNLDGSYDSRISFKVMREDYILDKNNRPQLVPCRPYIVTEASLHKCFYGQNVYGDMTDFQGQCQRFIDTLGVLLADDGTLLPSAKNWQVKRVDWSEMYQLTPAAIVEFFRGISHCKFPRRSAKSAKYGSNAVYFPGSTTTVKIYHKGPEFQIHDKGRVKHGLSRYLITQLRNDSALTPDFDQYQRINQLIEKKVSALQRLADNRLRVEVEIHSDKLAADFTPAYQKSRFPKVSEVTDDYLKAIHDTEIFKLLKEGKTEMETVRTADAVMARLNNSYGKRSANALYAYWQILSARGEDIARAQYSESQFYDNRRKLINAGISWHGTNVIVLAEQDTALPHGFVPLRHDPRICSRPIKTASIFNICPTFQQEEFKKAA